MLIKSRRNIVWKRLSTRSPVHDKLIGSFITHIDGYPVFSTKYSEKKLEVLYKEHLHQNQGVVTRKKNIFSFSITFAPETKLLGAKLNKAMDD